MSFSSIDLIFNVLSVTDLHIELPKIWGQRLSGHLRKANNIIPFRLLVAEIMQSAYLCVIFHIKHKKISFLAV